MRNSKLSTIEKTKIKTKRNFNTDKYITKKKKGGLLIYANQSNFTQKRAQEVLKILLFCICVEYKCLIS